MATALSAKSPGDIIKIRENGTVVECLVQAHNYAPGCTAVQRNQIHSSLAWDAGNSNEYNASDADMWCEDTYYNAIDADIRALIPLVEIQYTTGGNNPVLTALQRHVFLPSGTEIGFSTPADTNTEGSPFPYFDSDSRRIAQLNGANTTWLTRTRLKTSSTWIQHATPSGGFSSNDANRSFGMRPVFCLPSNTMIGDDGMVVPNQSPAPPPSITVPSSAAPGESITVRWTASSDPDGDAVTYKLRRDIGAGYVLVYSGANLSYRDIVPAGARYVQYEVCASDGQADSAYTTSRKVGVLIDLTGVILSGGQGKQLARTLPNPVTGLTAVNTADGILLNCDAPTEISSLYLKDYWITFKPSSQGTPQHPYDGEHLIFAAPAPTTGQPLSALAEGSKLKILENNVPTPFLVPKHGYPTAGAGQANTLLLREDIYDTRAWGTNNAYASSAIHSFLNDEYILLLEESVKNKIPTVSIPYTAGNGSNTLSYIDCKAFLLSGTEVGLSGQTYLPTEGQAIPYFASDQSRIARWNGEASEWWLRSPSTNRNDAAWNLTKSGSGDYNYTSYAYGLRPAFCLPSDTLVSGTPDADGYYTILV